MKNQEFERNLLATSNRFAKEKAYWQRKLADFTDFTEIPRGESMIGGSAASETSGCFSYMFSDRLSDKIMTASRYSEFGMYIAVTAGLMGLLYRYTDRQTITIGMPANHMDSDTGISINPYLILHVAISDSDTFKGILLNVMDTIREADENKSFPIETVLSQVHSRDELSRVKVMSLLQGTHLIDEQQRTADMVFEVFRKNNLVGVTLKYDPLGHTEKYLRRLCDRLTHFMDWALTAPGTPVGQIEMMSENERNRILTEFNDTRIAYPKEKAIHHLFEEQVLMTPDKVALVCGNKCMTYAELNAKANQLSWKLNELGIDRSTIVGIMAQRSIEMMVGIIAVLKAGGAYLPIDPNYPKERIRFMLEDSNTKLLLTDRMYQDYQVPDGMYQLFLDDREHYTGSEKNLALSTDSKQRAYVVYTSGSTGKPKGVSVRHANVINLFVGMIRSIPVNDIATVLSSAPISFDPFVLETLFPLTLGKKVVISEDTRDPYAICRLVSQEKIDMMDSTPSRIAQILSDPEMAQSLRGIKILTFGGEAVSESILKELQKATNARLFNMYGPTEATVNSTYCELTTSKYVTIGKPLANQQVYVMDSKFRILPIGVPGELYIAGDGVAEGYLNRPELTRERFIEHPEFPGKRLYRTGDEACWLEDGNLKYIGRLDQQVKVRGYRIELGEVEAVLSKHRKIEKAATAVKEGNDGVFHLCAYYISPSELSKEELSAFMSSYLPDYMIPSFFIRMEQMPLTPNDKLDLKALPAPVPDKAAYVAPASELEEKLASIWSAVLGVELVGVHSNFFDLGGDSIKAVQVIGKMISVLQRKCQLIELYRNPTVSTLAAFMEGADPRYEMDRTKAYGAWDTVREQILGHSDTAAKLPNCYVDFYPMSNIQTGMVLQDIRDPSLGFYHVQALYHLKEPVLHEELFLRAVDLMVNKHPILRTSFNVENFPMPIAIVMETVVPDIEFHHVIGADGNLERDVERFRKEDLQNKFSLLRHNDRPLWRMRVLRVGDGSNVLLLSFHHAILDGWSYSNFILELSNVYLRLMGGGMIEKLPPAEDVNRNHAFEELAVIGDERFHQYWKEELDQFQQLTFPEPREQISEDEGELGAIRRDFGADLTDKVDRISRTHGVPVRSILFAAYSFMLKMTTYSKDIVSGIVEHTRPLAEGADEALGCFLNTVPVRIRFKKDWTWLDVIRNIDEKLTAIKWYGKLPLAQIIKATSAHDGTENPLFKTFFNYVDFYRVQEVDSSILRYVDLTSIRRATDAAFEFTIAKESDGYKLEVQHKRGIVSDEWAERLITYFLNTILQMAEAPTTAARNSAVWMTEDVERLDRFNRTEKVIAPYRTVTDLVEEQIALHPEATAILTRNENLSYRQLGKAVREIAAGIHACGIEPEQAVGIMLRRSSNIVCAMLAVLKSGAAYVPIDPDLPDERIRYMLENSGAKMLIVEEDASENDVSYPCTLMGIQELRLRGQTSSIELPEVRAEQLAYIIYTSGSTGNPKGVMIEHRAVHNLLEGISTIIEFSHGKKVLARTTVSFDIAVLELLLPLMGGLTVVLADEEEQMDPLLLGELIRNNRVDIVQFTPSHLTMLVQAWNCSEILGNVTDILVGGEPLPSTLAKFVADRVQASIHNMYGPTETTVWSSSKHVVGSRGITIGSPLLNTKFMIVDEENQPLPVGVTGEICIAGAGIARGYMNLPEQNSNKFIYNSEWNTIIYRTGDFGKWLAEGELHCSGRRDHQVKIRGYRIELEEIESRLQQLDGIVSCAAFVADDAAGRVLGAYYTSQTGAQEMDVRAHLESSLPYYMVPQYISRLDTIPMTSNGKIDRKALPSLLTEGGSMGAEHDARSRTEGILQKLFQESLGKPSVSVHVSFFEQGGSSLQLIQLYSQIEKAFPGRLRLAQLFEYTTIAQLSQLIDGCDQDKRDLNYPIPYLPMPDEYRANRFGTQEIEMVRQDVPSMLYNKIMKHAEDHHVKLENIIMACYVYLLHRISGQPFVGVLSLLKGEPVKIVGVDVSQAADFQSIVELVKANNSTSLLEVWPIIDAVSGGKANIAVPSLVDQEHPGLENHLLAEEIRLSMLQRENRLSLRIMFQPNHFDAGKMNYLMFNYMNLLEYVMTNAHSEG